MTRAQGALSGNGVVRGGISCLPFLDYQAVDADFVEMIGNEFKDAPAYVPIIVGTVERLHIQAEFKTFVGVGQDS